ncbi:MAG TPA: polyphosphate kinase 1, partial [Cyclobacteriaceae bacterium]|nr:polyphosphate kinase 1 [Cyclobacteriaceae bacterium]
MSEGPTTSEGTEDKVARQIFESNYISRDLSWLQFNYRVLDQARHVGRSLFDRLKFLSITASNLDEFCTIRLGSLYNYVDYGKDRVDYSGLRENPFRGLLLAAIRKFVDDQNGFYIESLKPHFQENNFIIAGYDELTAEEAGRVDKYFSLTIYPMLTPMVFDSYHTFPVLKNHQLLFGVVTKASGESNNNKRVSFIQVPGNISRFYEIVRPDGRILFVPVELIIRKNIQVLFRNVEVRSINLFRINRNQDFTLEESEDIESNFLEELRRKLQTRKSGRVVRLDVHENADPWMLRVLKIQWDIDDQNIITIPREGLLDFTGLLQIINHTEFKDQR